MTRKNGRSVAGRTVQKSVPNQWQFSLFATHFDIYEEISLNSKSLIYNKYLSK
ncbi:hypothetical protein O0882_22810 [Janthinobacterium sp. SUN073]|uniref:hypothetical protein n=1 Tax=Janthinobacterium sp. SUN073 TaxID=3004102 RepID=UPI0025AFE403|nr:hypothetical protein [Janthinobacterium sp. SUN073]MDN2699151.1 hypothetical protein [Janthinobacterium sp. SUN073]